MDALQLVLRIAHIAAAVTLGGAVVFQLLAVQPVLRGLDDAQRTALAAGLARRWRGVLWTGMALLLVSGLLNFLLFKVPEYKTVPYKAVYHGLFGVKFLAALALFHAATMLSMPGPAFDRYRRRARGWLSYATVLLALIVVLAAVMRYLPTFYD